MVPKAGRKTKYFFIWMFIFILACCPEGTCTQVSVDQLDDVIRDALQKAIANLPQPLPLADMNFSVDVVFGPINTTLSGLSLTGLQAIQIQEVQLINASTIEGRAILSASDIFITGIGQISGNIASTVPFDYSGEVAVLSNDTSVLLDFSLSYDGNNTFTLRNVSSQFLVGSNISSLDIPIITSPLNDALIQGIVLAFKPSIESQIAQSLFSVLSPDLELMIENSTIIFLGSAIGNLSGGGADNSGLCNNGSEYLDSLMADLKARLSAVEPVSLRSFQFVFIFMNNGQLNGFSNIKRVGDIQLSCNTTNGRDILGFNLMVSSVRLQQNFIFRSYRFIYLLRMTATLSSLTVRVQIAVGKGNVTSVLQLFNLDSVGNVNINVFRQTRLSFVLNNLRLFRNFFRQLLADTSRNQIRLALADQLRQQ
ncbi:uncharacterized protein LOC106476957 [Limulus polyphemus]|uniref:Uncharacterized protein LOC106476957 n=1 Tax=Limulus polyphemus TaxID=6850 RepID=A0ABM1RYE1_LIMPO|nr:uncharacterized protein LOC106476957 [Limulus polyphemus]